MRFGTAPLRTHFLGLDLPVLEALPFNSWSAIMPRSTHGGRHELGQNFLVHGPTLEKIAAIVAATQGPILEIGSGSGALTRHLARLQRPLTAIDIDEHRVAKLRQRCPVWRSNRPTSRLPAHHPVSLKRSFHHDADPAGSHRDVAASCAAHPMGSGPQTCRRRGSRADCSAHPGSLSPCTDVPSGLHPR